MGEWEIEIQGKYSEGKTKSPHVMNEEVLFS